MKYIKVADYGLFGTDTLTPQDLGRVKSKEYVTIINRIEETYFDAEKNSWEKIVSH